MGMSNKTAALATRTPSPLMPGARVREDGWTAARTTLFLAVLTQTGCVSDAARLAGVSRTSVNRARAKYPPFDKACREALGQALQGLEAVAYQRAVAGRETVVIRKGEEVERRIAPSDALLKLLIQRGDMAGVGPVASGAAPTDSRGRALTPDDYITREEGQEGFCWINGRKTDEAKGAKARLIAVIGVMRERARSYEENFRICRRCDQPLSDAALARVKALNADPEASDAPEDHDLREHARRQEEANRICRRCAQPLSAAALVKVKEHNESERRSDAFDDDEEE
jgi:hypothetical protein